MKTLFDSIEYYSSKSPTISTEMIAPQVGDYIVAELNKAHKELLDISAELYKSGKSKSYNMFKLPSVKNIIERMDTLLSNRFGINIETIFTPNTLACCVPITTSEKWFNIDVYRLMEGLFDIINKRANPDKEKQEELINSKKKIDEVLNKKSITFDLNRAVINGLPNDIQTQVCINYING